MDCCPISEGAAAFVVSADRIGAKDLTAFGARQSSARALEAAGVGVADIGYAGIYDSFTITLAIPLEEIGLSRRGDTTRMASCR